MKWSCDAGKCKQLPDKGAACTLTDKCVEKTACTAEGKCEGAAKKCDDGEFCTVDSCDANTGCKVDSTANEGKDCNDGDACTEGDKCGSGKCQPGAGAACDDSNDCTVDKCDKATGKCDFTTFTNKDTKCDDGDYCSGDDVCDGKGKCTAGGKSLCKCKTDAECKSQDDGNACNGTSFCNKTLEVWDCTANPATVPFCSPLLDNLCRVNACDFTTGSCKLIHPNQAVAKCDPNNPKLCWKQQDTSKATPVFACKDGDPCTSALCNKDGQCVIDANLCPCTTSADCKAKEDGDLCNGTLYCKPGAGCVVNPATVISCSDSGDTACLQNKCDSAKGACVAEAINENGSCTDGNPCTGKDGVDNCKAGKCVPGTDLCGCKSDADCAAQTELQANALCDGVLYCDLSKGEGKCRPNPKTKVFCSSLDDNECRANKCDPKTGKCAFKYVDKFTTCNADGTPCTKDDVCDGKGNCDAGTHICTCAKDADCSKYQDANKCLGTVFCDKSFAIPKCVVNPKTVVQCKTGSDNFCVKTLCDPATGKCGPKFTNPNQVCNDGDPCTVSEHCKDGKCQGGTDVCKCKVDSDCYDDGNVCNGAAFCDKSKDGGTCVNNPATAITCDPKSDNGCAKNTCQPTTGKCAIAADGSCAAANKNPCVLSLCNIKDGKCESKNFIDGTPCSGGQCIAGKCLADTEGWTTIPGGTAYLGCSSADGDCHGNEKPPVAIVLSPYLVGTHEVTVKAYEACVKAGKCTVPTAPTGSAKLCNYSDKIKADERPAHPMNCVDRAMALAYCASIGGDLPTEAQWEVAARGACAIHTGDCKAATTVWPWGPASANCEFTIIAEDGKEGCGAERTAPVGSRPKDKSPYGVLDMGGNVSEWTSDYIDQLSYSKIAADTKDPASATKGTQPTVRGGSIASTPKKARVGDRKTPANTKLDYRFGIRCVKAL